MGQYVDIAMFDAIVAMTDIVTNFWSLGVRPEPDKGLEVICEGFRASDGYVVVQIVREHQFDKLADVVGPSRMEGRSALRDARGLGPGARVRDPARGRRVGVDAHEARGRAGAHRSRASSRARATARPT